MKNVYPAMNCLFHFIASSIPSPSSPKENRFYKGKGGRMSKNANKISTCCTFPSRKDNNLHLTCQWILSRQLVYGNPHSSQTIINPSDFWEAYIHGIERLIGRMHMWKLPMLNILLHVFPIKKERNVNRIITFFL
jgi:hypothetical protein